MGTAKKMGTLKKTGQAGFSKQSKQEPFSLKGQVATSNALNHQNTQLFACGSRPLPGLGGSACPLMPSATPLRPNPSPTFLCDPTHYKFPSSKFILYI